MAIPRRSTLSFVNLVDNSIFWVKDKPVPRLIKIDFKDGVMSVADSGAGVPLRDREAIFDLGFTRKPGGRGLGLHIAREVLGKVGYSLTLGRTSPESGAEFLIAKDSRVEKANAG